MRKQVREGLGTHDLRISRQEPNTEVTPPLLPIEDIAKQEPNFFLKVMKPFIRLPRELFKPIETWRTCFLLLLENLAMKKRKTRLP